MATILQEIISDDSWHCSVNGATYFNLINPSKTSWETLLPAVTWSYKLKSIKLAEWIEELDQVRDPSDADYSQMPALKLLDFYKDAMRDTSRGFQHSIQTENGRRISPTMRGLEPITESLMYLWIRQWKF